jgi:hypothetical protein
VKTLVTKSYENLRHQVSPPGLATRPYENSRRYPASKKKKKKPRENCHHQSL